MINPIGMTLKEWSDAVILTENTSWSFGRLDDEEHWRSWGIGFLRATPSAQQAPPDPYQFDNWFDWATRMCLFLEAS